MYDVCSIYMVWLQLSANINRPNGRRHFEMFFFSYFYFVFLQKFCSQHQYVQVETAHYNVQQMYIHMLNLCGFSIIALLFRHIYCIYACIYIHNFAYIRKLYKLHLYSEIKWILPHFAVFSIMFFTVEFNDLRNILLLPVRSVLLYAYIYAICTL